MDERSERLRRGPVDREILMNKHQLGVFGEVLFDVFPDGARVLGGAAFNVAWHLQAFGQAPLFISRIGEDPEGMAVRTAMQEWGMTTDALQTDPELPTGRVKVHFDNGEPQYEILHPGAFDAIDDNITTARPSPRFRLLYHGSLALRSATSRQALEQILGSRPCTIFIDVNLRPPWWRRDVVLEWIDAADWVKLNQHELNQLSATNGNDLDQAAMFLTRHHLEGVVLTRGDQGADLLTASGACHRIKPDENFEIVDTVGAGDAFCAVILLGLACDWELDLTLSRAQIFASAICRQRGATTRNADFYRPFVDNWH